MIRFSTVLTIGTMLVLVVLISALLAAVALNISGLYAAPQFVFDFLGLTIFKTLIGGIFVLLCALFLQELGA